MPVLVADDLFDALPSSATPFKAVPPVKVAKRTLRGRLSGRWIGVVAAANVGISVVALTGLTLALNTSHHETATARAQTAAAQAQMMKAQQAERDTNALYQSDHSALRHANSTIAAFRPVAARANQCISAWLQVSKSLVDGMGGGIIQEIDGLTAASAAMDRSAAPCSGLGPLLTNASSS